MLWHASFKNIVEIFKIHFGIKGGKRGFIHFVADIGEFLDDEPADFADGVFANEEKDAL